MRTSAFAFTLAVLLAAPATAQYSRGWEADIPFSFYAGDVQLPAGTYSLASASDSGMFLRITAVRGTGAPASALILVRNRLGHDRKAVSPDLHFNKYSEDRIFFSGVTSPTETGFNAVLGKRERELITSTITASAKPVSVVVAASRVSALR